MTALTGATPAVPVRRRASPGWVVVAGHELRVLWLSGRGLTLLLAHTLVLSLSTYLVATNQELNFLEQRDAVRLTLTLGVAVGGLLVLLAAADGVSGERDRGTLEVLLLSPVPRSAVVVGKGLAAVSLWAGAYALALPYVWWLGRDVGTFGPAATAGLLVGSLLAVFAAGLGLLISTFTTSNGTSLVMALLTLLALAVPHQLPPEATRGWAGELLLRADPVSAGLTYLERVVVGNHALTQDAGLLAGPVVAAVVLPVLAVVASRRLRLLPRAGS